MKNNTTKLLIVLAALIGVFAVVKITRTTNRSSSFKTELVNIPTEQVDKIEVISPSEKVTLTKSEDNWMVETPLGPKPALEGNVTSLLSTLNTIAPTRLAARSKSKWKDFSVDSTGTQVIVSGGKEVFTDIMLGRFGVEGQRSFYTYVRLTEDEDVYVAADFMKMSVSSSNTDFRNNVVARMSKDSIAEIALNYPDSAVVLSKVNEQWMKAGQPADSTAMANYLKNLGILSSRNFTEPSSTLNPDLNVTFSFINGSEVQLSAYKEDTQWVVSSSENQDEVWTDQALFDKVFAASSQF